MYKEDLVLNNLQGLISYNTQPNKEIYLKSILTDKQLNKC